MTLFVYFILGLNHLLEEQTTGWRIKLVLWSATVVMKKPLLVISPSSDQFSLGNFAINVIRSIPCLISSSSKKVHLPDL